MAENSDLKMFYATLPAPCPYLNGRTERKLFTKIDADNGEKLANTLSRAGFRRTHTICYLPACPECDACTSVRVPVDTFVPTKKQKKVWRLNKNLSVFLTPNVATAEQYDLFVRYLNARHQDSEMNDMDEDAFRAMVEDCPVPCFLLEIRDEGTDKLRGVMLTDVLDDGLSAVYSFFDPDMKQNSLGTFLILTLIRQAVALGVPYVYLGYYIAECPNMAYKRRFQPLERFADGAWTMCFKS